MIVYESAGSVVLIDRAIVDRERRAIIFVSDAGAGCSNGEGAWIVIADQVWRVILSAHVEGDVSLHKIVCVDLVLGVEAEALAPDVIANNGLRLIISELNAAGPGSEIESGDEIDPARLEGRLVETSLRGERQRRTGRQSEGADIIRKRRIEPRAEAKVGCVRGSITVRTGNLIGLSANDIGIAAVLEIQRGLRAIIGPRAGLELVIA